MNAKWREFIESTPEVLHGKPRIKDTRIPVSLILGYLASGKGINEVIADFPGLTDDKIKACLDYARELSEFESAG